MASVIACRPLSNNPNTFFREKGRDRSPALFI